MVIKLVFFDMEGVLLKKKYEGDKLMRSVWARISNELGEKAWNAYQRTYEKWKKKEYKNYFEWVDEIMEIYQKRGLTESLFENIINSSQHHKGVKEVFKKLKRKGIKTAIVSGGYKEHVDLVARELGVDHSTAACELRWRKGKLDSWNVLPFDEQGKVAVINLIRKFYGFKKKECMFVGDGRNDVYAAKSVGKSIAFNANEELKKACNVVINQEKGKEDLSEVLKYL